MASVPNFLDETAKRRKKRRTTLIIRNFLREIYLIDLFYTKSLMVKSGALILMENSSEWFR